MKIGLVPVNIGARTGEMMLGLAQLAEQVGFESTWTFEHAIIPVDYQSKYPYNATGKMGAVERELYQVKNQSPKDKIAFPIKLNNRLSGLLAIVDGDAPPTEAQYRVFQELSVALSQHLRRLERILGADWPQLR